MPSFSLTRMVLRPADDGTSRITDLVIGEGRLSDVLYSTTRFDGQIDSWTIDGTALTPRDTAAFDIGPQAGNQPSLAFVDGKLLSGGGSGGALTLRDLSNNGNFGSNNTINGTAAFTSPLVQPVVVQLADGNIGIYAGFATAPGIAQVILDPDDSLISTGTIRDRGRTASNEITALASGDVNGETFVYSASASDLGISAWQLRDEGDLRPRETLRPETGLWASDPTVIVSLQVDGQAYVVMGAAGSGSLTMISVGSRGELAVVDHVIDDRNTRFDGVTAIAATQHQGQTWIFAGGADDGITAFQVLPGGRLLARGSIADTNEMTLANISSIAARSNGSGIDLFVASATEPGLSRLSFMISTEDDVILDTAGSDRLTGGAGADVFVMGADGQTDTITDFTLGEDRLDLSDWNGLRSLKQLFFEPTSDGIKITYGDEVLILRSADGSPLDAASFTETDLIAPTRIPQVITPGNPGPITDPPALPALPDPPPLADPIAVEPPPRPEFYGTRDADTITGGDGSDLIYGVGGDDILSGAGGSDLLFGGQGRDLLRGDEGNDYLFGGGGRDGTWQSLTRAIAPNNGDTLEGGAGDDELYGQAGNDVLDGGQGDDLLVGGGGRDTFVFRSGQDRVADFNPVTDRISLDDGLWSGSLTTDQIIARYATETGDDIVFTFDDGNRLQLDDFDDLGLLADRIDIL